MNRILYDFCVYTIIILTIVPVCIYCAIVGLIDTLQNYPKNVYDIFDRYYNGEL